MSGVSVVQPDITPLLDMDGVIRDARFPGTIPNEGIDTWLGRPWVETVGGVGSERVRRMLQDASASGVSAFGHVTQRFPSGLELPIEYTAVRLGGRTGLIAIGRNLQGVAKLQSRLIATQQAREQDYWKLRAVETRYRLLFDASNEAVILLGADSLLVVEVNPTAIREFGFGPGEAFLPELPLAERDRFQAMLARAREHGRAPGIVVHPGADRRPWMLRASLITAEPGPVLLLQLAAMDGMATMPAGRPSVPAEDMVDRLPDAFVCTDPAGVIGRANPAFLDLVQMGSAETVLGAPLGRWLRQPGADAAALLRAIRRHRVVQLFATRIEGEYGSDTPVEISAAVNGDGRAPFVCVVLRSVGSREAAPADGDRLGAALRGATGRLGQTTLPELVRDTTQLVERHYIEAALERAEGNRTAAAELLGLSRQSLYLKLHRYGVNGPVRSADEPTD